VNGFREIIEWLTSPRINEYQGRIILKKRAWEDFFRPMAPL
jgi:hypothetical protein